MTTNPTGAWVAQQARNLANDGAATGIRFLIRDRDTKHTHASDAILESEGVRAIRTPLRTRVANAYAERVAGTTRRDCLDWLLIYGRRHPKQVLRTYAEHHNAHRPHRARGLTTRSDTASHRRPDRTPRPDRRAHPRLPAHRSVTVEVMASHPSDTMVFRRGSA